MSASACPGSPGVGGGEYTVLGCVGVVLLGLSQHNESRRIPRTKTAQCGPAQLTSARFGTAYLTLPCHFKPIMMDLLGLLLSCITPGH